MDDAQRTDSVPFSPMAASAEVRYSVPSSERMAEPDGKTVPGAPENVAVPLALTAGLRTMPRNPA